MQIHVVINGGVSLVIRSENPMEEEILKTLTKQENDIVEIRNSISLLEKNVQSGVIIGKKLAKTEKEAM